MPTRLRRRSPFKALILPVILCGVAGYFGWQGTRGDFSHDAREAMRAERAERQAVLTGLIDQRKALQARVERLRAGALDADLLDERARAKLNMAHANEIVIFHNHQAQGQPVSQALVSR
ncbi:MAG: septum formation initiator family protein [Devosia sp.]